MLGPWEGCAVRIVLLALACLLSPAVACAQFKDQAPEKGPTLGRAVTTRYRVGFVVKAEGGLIFNIVGTSTVPTDWPEQQVKIVKEDLSPTVKHLTYRTLAGGGAAKQLVMEIPQLAKDQEGKALVTFEVTRHSLIAPRDTSIYHIPKKLDRTLLLNVGPSPYIESKHPKIVAAAKEAMVDKETDWEKVEALYDWTRENVKFTSGDLKGAARALYDKEGDIDELTSLFIALCRVHKIPARTVFVPGHCYAEFYLEDDDGQGHWFPCQPAGKREFGGIEEARPILQKGDNFKNPENKKERLRFVTEHFNANSRGGKPNVESFSSFVPE